MTEIVRVSADAGPDDKSLMAAGIILRRGGLVAFPTETVYGLGANGLDRAAVERIYIAKGRPADNPMILHVASCDDMLEVASDLPEAAFRLAARFWPGPLTLVLKRRPCVPEIVSAGLPTVAVRVPAHTVALSLIRAAGVPIAAPSANISGRPSPTTAAHVRADLDGRVETIIDAGPTAVGLESTVLDLTAPVPTLLRPGGITVEQLRIALAESGLDLCGGNPERPLAPGMKYRHYAPRAPLTVVTGDPAAVRTAIATCLAKAAAEGRRLAVLVHADLVADLCRLGLVLDLGPRGRPDIAAQRLFSLLRACDGEGVDEIMAEAEAEEGVGLAVMNRLLKAAGGRILHAGEGTRCAAD